MRTCARVDVDFPRDLRLMRIPPGPRRAQAIGVWLAALCYSRRELDGFCPMEVLDALSSEGVVQDLVDVGLFARSGQDGLAGVVVVDYAECNPTKAQGGAT
jgi:hypothetical protein